MDVDDSAITETADGIALTARDVTVSTTEARSLASDFDETGSSARDSANFEAFGHDPLGFALDITFAINTFERTIAATIDGSALTALGDILIAATNATQLGAYHEASVAAVMNDAASWGGLTLGGTYSSNLIRANVEAIVTDSVLEAQGFGNIRVAAIDDSGIDARAAAGADTSGGSTFAGSASIAFNAIGISNSEPFSVLLDDLLGRDAFSPNPFAEDAAWGNVVARIAGGQTSAGGDIAVEALSDAGVNATVSSVAESTAASVYGAQSLAVGSVLALTRVNRAITAEIAGGNTTRVGGALRVDSRDNAFINANVKVVNSAATANDGGAAVLDATVNRLFPAAYDTAFDTVVTLEFGDLVRVGGDWPSDLGERGTVHQYLGAAPLTVDFTDGSVTGPDFADFAAQGFTNLD